MSTDAPTCMPTHRTRAQAVKAVPEDAAVDDPAVLAFLEAHCSKVVAGARALRDLMLQP